MLLASHMLILGGLAANEQEAGAKLRVALESGAGLKKLEAMLVSLGAAPGCLDDMDALCKTRRQVPVLLAEAGYIEAMEANRIGSAAQILGAGRAKKTDRIDPAVGLVMHKRQGDYVAKDEPLATLYVNDETRLEEAAALLRGAVRLSPEQPTRAPMVHDVIRA